jgi:hypothetical protein
MDLQRGHVILWAAYPTTRGQIFTGCPKSTKPDEAEQRKLT